jgi:hypothetical protein
VHGYVLASFVQLGRDAEAIGTFQEGSGLGDEGKVHGRSILPFR